MNRNKSLGNTNNVIRKERAIITAVSIPNVEIIGIRVNVVVFRR
ncbi:hypothetical protein ACFLXY_10785 [Chloroflexota bacterium]